MAQKQVAIARELHNILEPDCHQSLMVEKALLYLNYEETTSRLPFRPKVGNIYIYFLIRPDQMTGEPMTTNG